MVIKWQSFNKKSLQSNKIFVTVVTLFDIFILDLNELFLP